MLEDEWLGVEEIGLGEGVAQQSPSLAVQRCVTEAEDAQRLLTHGLVDGRFDESGLLAINLPDRIDVREGDLIRTDTNGGAVSLMQLVKGQGAITRQVDQYQPLGRQFGQQRPGDAT